MNKFRLLYLISLIIPYNSIVHFGIQRRNCYLKLIFKSTKFKTKKNIHFNNEGKIYKSKGDLGEFSIDIQIYVKHISIFFNGKKNEELTQKIEKILSKNYKKQLTESNLKLDPFKHSICNYHEHLILEGLDFLNEEKKFFAKQAYDTRIKNCKKFFDFEPVDNIYIFKGSIELKSMTFYFNWFFGEEFEKSINIFIFSDQVGFKEMIV